MTVCAAGPDLSLHGAAAGDRYRLCSDGLSTVVAAESLREVLTGPGSPQQELEELVTRAYAASAPRQHRLRCRGRGRAGENRPQRMPIGRRRGV